jgi:hypothetical protein
MFCYWSKPTFILRGICSFIPKERQSGIGQLQEVAGCGGRQSLSEAAVSSRDANRCNAEDNDGTHG